MVTLTIIVVTSIISFVAFYSKALVENFIFIPSAANKGQWYRFITHGLLHADLGHLFFNMFALYLFGVEIERVFCDVFGDGKGKLFYVLLYLTSLIVAILPTYFKQKYNYDYRSLGASGGVSAIVFAYILVYPMSFMGIVFVPVFLPAFLFGIIYIAVSIYLDKKQSQNINHLAHITGGIYGIVYIFIVFLVFARINLFSFFIQNIHISSVNDLIRFGYN
ncbi:MAG: rhomboid family intramembrane serine protease [Paludibacteraceae bacterium]